MSIKHLRLKRAFLPVLFTLLLSLAGLTNALAQEFTVGNLNYSVNDDGVSVTLTGYEGYIQGALVIPENVEYDGYSYEVTAIGNYTFVHCYDLTSITIPESVTFIGYHVFYDSGLTTLNYNAINCYVSEYWLYGCDSLTTLTIGDNVQVIPDYFVSGQSNLVGELVIPESVTSIGYDAFGYSNFEAITVETGNPFYDSRGNCNAIIETANNDLLLGCKNTIIPVTVTSIGGSAFVGCSGLTSITIPSSVIHISNGSFGYCSGLEQIIVESGNAYYDSRGNCNAIIETANNDLLIGCKNSIIPETVTSIGYEAFIGCSSLTSITIPYSVTSIDDEAFYDCSGLASIDIYAGRPPKISWWMWTFEGVDHDIPVRVPCGCLSAYQEASGWGSFSNIQEFNPCVYAINANPNVDVGVSMSGCGVYEYGQNCTLMAIPQGDYEFLNWTEDGEVVSTDIVYSFTVTCSRNLVANFAACSIVISGLWNSGSIRISYDGGFHEQLYFGNYFGKFGHTVTRIVPDGCLVMLDNYEYEDPYGGPDDEIVVNYEDGDEIYSGELYDGFAYGFVVHCGVNPNANSSCPIYIYFDFGCDECYYGEEEEDHIVVMSYDDGSFEQINLDLSGYFLYYRTYNIPDGTHVTLSSDGDWNARVSVGYEGIELSHSLWDLYYEDYVGSGYGFDFDVYCPCTINIDLNDSGGDGWNGNRLWMYSHYPPIHDWDYVDILTFDEGSSASFNYNVPNGTHVRFAWEEGSNVEECSFTVSYDNGAVIYQSSDLSEGDLYEFDVDCFNQPDTYSITVSANPTEGGTVSGAGNYGEGLTCTLTATANPGYSFINWTKDGEEVSTEAIYSFTVTEDAAYVANFTESQDEITQTSTFAQGYNWWSTYVEQAGMDGLGMLEESLGDNGLTIRSQASGYTDYYQGYGWYGSLSSLNNESSYRIITSAPCTVTMTGNIAVPSQHPITLSQGWTWIGYVPSTAMGVNDALSGLEATVGDKLKSQQGYADYYENYGWYGSLNTIEPGMGLMYYSANSATSTFTYPDSNRSGELKANLTSEANHWVPNIYAYPDNMTVMAVVELDDMELTSDNYELAAFAANGECRGSVRLTFAEPLNRHVAFLTISGKDAAELSFRLYDTETNVEYYDAEESLDFVADAIVGEATDLYTIHFRGTTGMDEFANRVRVYPNPVNRGERVSIGMKAESKSPVRVEIVNALGAVVSKETSTQAPASIVAPVTAGVYTLRITVEGKGTAVRKLVVK